MTNYYVKRIDAESLIGAWCDWNTTTPDGEYILYNGGYNRAMRLHVPLFNENGECVADTL